VNTADAALGSQAPQRGYTLHKSIYVQSRNWFLRGLG
jgi:hypothetical protein